MLISHLKTNAGTNTSSLAHSTHAGNNVRHDAQSDARERSALLDVRWWWRTVSGAAGVGVIKTGSQIAAPLLR